MTHSRDEFPLYHWSPTERRKSINKYGLRPSSRSVDGSWKPPFICFSDTPSLAWSLSGDIHRRLGGEVKSWDLWMMWNTVPSGMELLPFDDGEDIKEYRVYERVFKRDLWYVATRITD